MKRALLLIAAFLIAPAVFAQTWKPIVNLNMPGYCDSHNRCVYRTNSGTLYVLVNASPISSGASSLRILKSTLQTPTSFTEMNAANRPTDSSRFIGVDGRLNTATGIISIVYEPTNTTTANYTTFNTNTDTWGTPETIATLAGQDGLRYKSHVAMALDAAGIPHAIYGGANQGFFYNNRTGGTWSASLQLTAASSDEHPSLVMGPDGVLHLAWFNQTGSRSILYRERSAAGSWSATETVASSIGTFGDPVDQSPSIALDSTNLPLILYHEQVDINADVVIKKRTAANTYADVSPPVAGPPSTGGHDWSIAVTWNGDWIVCGHMMQNPVQPACKTRSNATGSWGSLVTIASGVAKDGSASMRYDPLYPGNTSTLDVEESDENSPLSDWFYNAVITPAPPPSIFFQDLRSGPITGGQNNKGTFLTIYGTGFGAFQGTSTVSVGGGVVDNCPVWGASWLWYQKITCQLGANAVTGNVVVTVGGQASNCANAEEGCSFTVRSGGLFFVSTGGSDAANGSFATPWLTMYHAKAVMVAGDTVYVMNGVQAKSQDQFNSCFDYNKSGTPTSPVAFVAYPGATATIGGVAAPCGNSYRTIEQATAGGGPYHDQVLAGFNIIEDGAANGNMAQDTQGVTGYHFIGNQIDCLGTNGGQAACWESEAGANNMWAYGNHLRQFATSDKQWHGFYFSTNSNHIWLGWNSIHDGGCRGIQFHSTGAPNQFDLHVHDNLLYNIRCDAINMATIAPQNGPVEVYNNVIFHSGLGPDFGAQGAAAYTCILSAGITNSGSPGTGNMLWYGNTLYDCSSRPGGGTTEGAIGVASSPGVKLNNNIFISIAGDVGGYLSADATTSVISGSNNACSGSGNCPASFGSGSVNANPGFVNTAGCATGTLASCDLHLSASASPANGAGTATQTSLYDHDGLVRPAPPSVGAYEFTASSAAPQTNPVVTLNPTSIGFGNQILATTSATQTTTLSNTGTGTLTISAIALTGTNAGDFSIFSNSCGATLGVGANCIIGVRFTPLAIGARSANLTFTTNAASSPDNLALSGIGVQNDIYLAQAAAGASTGVDCSTTKAVSFFNASGNWGTTPGQISGGITVHLCGTITSSLVVPASQGTGLITIKFEPGASMQQAAAQNFIGIFNRTNSYLITGQAPCGFQNGAFVPCTEAIKNTANGSPSGFANTVTGIKMLDFSGTSGSVTVQWLEIGPGYVHNDPNDNTFSDGAHLAIAVFADSINQQGSISVLGSHVHDHSFSISINPRQASATIPPTVTVANVEFFHNDHDIAMGAACSPACYFASYHHNHSHDHSNWDTTNNAYHHDGIHIFGTFDQAFETDIYNNLFDGPWEGNGTGPIFNQSAVQNLKAFNNIFDCTPANCTQDPSALWQYGGGPNQLLANNSFIQTGLPHGTGPNFTNNGGVLMTNPNGNSVNVSFLNNIVDSATNEVSFNSQVLATNTATSGLDYNLYSNAITNGSRNFGWNGTLTDSFATWRTLSGEGLHSQLVGDALLSAAFAPQTGSPAIGTGTNLTSLCVGTLVPLCSDYNGLARPSSGSWNIGAIGNPPTGGTPLAALSQTTAAFFNQMVGTTTSLPMVVTLSNNGTAVLSITSLTFTGTNLAEFGQSNNCGAGIAAGTSCLITITFSPSALGPRSATLNVNDNASGSPHTVSLSGNGMKSVGGAGTITGTGTWHN